MQNVKQNPEKWNALRVEDRNPKDRQRSIEHHGDDGHELVLVTRLNENGNPHKRWGYDETGRHTRVDNTTYKCVNCGVETGTTPRVYDLECGN